MGLMHTEAIQIHAEAYDVALDISFPRGAYLSTVYIHTYVLMCILDIHVIVISCLGELQQ